MASKLGISPKLSRNGNNFKSYPETFKSPELYRLAVLNLLTWQTAVKCDRETIWRHLLKPATISFSFNFGFVCKRYTLLQYAIMFDTKFAIILIDTGFDDLNVNYVGRDNQTALSMAFDRRDEELIAKLLQYPGIDVELGMRRFYERRWFMQFDLIKLLLKFLPLSLELKKAIIKSEIKLNKLNLSIQDLYCDELLPCLLKHKPDYLLDILFEKLPDDKIFEYTLDYRLYRHWKFPKSFRIFNKIKAYYKNYENYDILQVKKYLYNMAYIAPEGYLSHKEIQFCYGLTKTYRYYIDVYSDSFVYSDEMFILRNGNSDLASGKNICHQPYDPQQNKYEEFFKSQFLFRIVMKFGKLSKISENSKNSQNSQNKKLQLFVKLMELHKYLIFQIIERLWGLKEIHNYM